MAKASATVIIKMTDEVRAKFTKIMLRVEEVYAKNQCLQIRVGELEGTLKEIAKYDSGNGCCSYGCDTPYIAQQALTPPDTKEGE